MHRLAPLLLVAAISFCSPGAASTSAGGTCERAMAAAARRYDVPLAILYAVALTETGQRGALRPFALNIEGRSWFGKSVTETAGKVRAALAAGDQLIDIGCMQIDHRWHAHAFASLEAMLDPVTNVDYAARFLKELHEREGSWTVAVARYHAGPDQDREQLKYVCAVIRNMVGSGFGGWTGNAASFCRR